MDVVTSGPWVCDANLSDKVNSFSSDTMRYGPDHLDEFSFEEAPSKRGVKSITDWPTLNDFACLW